MRDKWEAVVASSAEDMQAPVAGSLHGAEHIDGGGGGCGVVVVVVGDLACKSLARGRCACVVQRTRRSWH